jgi:predicted nucleotidyltransferase
MWNKKFDPAEAAREAVQAARRVIGDRLSSATLYGSAATGEFRHAHSDVNIAFIFTVLGAHELEVIRQAHREWEKRRVIRPLLLSEASLDQSRDTFPLEYLLIRERHVALHGPDPFASIAVDRGALRSQVERVLRAQELGLAVSYVSFASTPAGARRWAAEAGSALAASASGLLYLIEGTVPVTRKETVARCAARFGIDAAVLSTLLTRERQGGGALPATRFLESAQALLRRLLEETERLDGSR